MFYLFQDELTSVSVKQGFNAAPSTSDEYGSAKSFNINASKVSVIKNINCCIILCLHQ